jgi:hypothetical protein
MIAPRHLPALAALLALATVPTVVHTYVDRPLADGRTAADVPMRLNGLDGRGTERSQDWVRNAYGTTDFIERAYGPDLTLFVARSYDAKRLYHHPENGVAHGDGYDRAVVARTPDRADVPIFVLNNGRDRYSLYALNYGDDFIADPIRFQLRNAFTLLVRPRALMTLFFVRGRMRGDSPSAGTAPGEALLLAAIDGFASQRGTPSP